MTKSDLLKKEAKPILFNTEMVQAILDGRKTVTRRVIKPQPISKLCYCCMGYMHGTWGYPSKDDYKYWDDESFKLPDDFPEIEINKRWNPLYHKDDIIYVRETWNYGYIDSSDEYLNSQEWFEELDPKKFDDSSYLYGISGYIYKADMTENECRDIYMKWKPSIHMPKEAARIFLKVTNVRVERLQDILKSPYGKNNQVVREGCKYTCDFIALWDSAIKKSDLDGYGWDANPWVFVYEFEVIDLTGTEASEA